MMDTYKRYSSKNKNMKRMKSTKRNLTTSYNDDSDTEIEPTMEDSDNDIVKKNPIPSTNSNSTIAGHGESEMKDDAGEDYLKLLPYIKQEVDSQGYDACEYFSQQSINPCTSTSTPQAPQNKRLRMKIRRKYTSSSKVQHEVIYLDDDGDDLPSQPSDNTYQACSGELTSSETTSGKNNSRKRNSDGSGDKKKKKKKKHKGKKKKRKNKTNSSHRDDNRRTPSPDNFGLLWTSPTSYSTGLSRSTVNNFGNTRQIGSRSAPTSPVRSPTLNIISQHCDPSNSGAFLYPPMPHLIPSLKNPQLLGMFQNSHQSELSTTNTMPNITKMTADTPNEQEIMKIMNSSQQNVADSSNSVSKFSGRIENTQNGQETNSSQKNVPGSSNPVSKFSGRIVDTLNGQKMNSAQKNAAGSSNPTSNFSGQNADTLNEQEMNSSQKNAASGNSNSTSNFCTRNVDTLNEQEMEQIGSGSSNPVSISGKRNVQIPHEQKNNSCQKSVAPGKKTLTPNFRKKQMDSPNKKKMENTVAGSSNSMSNLIEKNMDTPNEQEMNSSQKNVTTGSSERVSSSKLVTQNQSKLIPPLHLVSKSNALKPTKSVSSKVLPTDSNDNFIDLDSDDSYQAPSSEAQRKSSDNTSNAEAHETPQSLAQPISSDHTFNAESHEIQELHLISDNSNVPFDTIFKLPLLHSDGNTDENSDDEENAYTFLPVKLLNNPIAAGSTQEIPTPFPGNLGVPVAIEGYLCKAPRNQKDKSSAPVSEEGSTEVSEERDASRRTPAFASTDHIEIIGAPSDESLPKGTKIIIQGVVWKEVENGLLVLNVTYRKRTYVGTLIDSSKYHWQPTLGMYPEGDPRRRTSSQKFNINFFKRKNASEIYPKPDLSKDSFLKDFLLLSIIKIKEECDRSATNQKEFESNIEVLDPFSDSDILSASDDGSSDVPLSVALKIIFFVLLTFFLNDIKNNDEQNESSIQQKKTQDGNSKSLPTADTDNTADNNEMINSNSEQERVAKENTPEKKLEFIKKIVNLSLTVDKSFCANETCRLSGMMDIKKEDAENDQDGGNECSSLPSNAHDFQLSSLEATSKKYVIGIGDAIDRNLANAQGQRGREKRNRTLLNALNCPPKIAVTLRVTNKSSDNNIMEKSKENNLHGKNNDKGNEKQNESDSLLRKSRDGDLNPAPSTNVLTNVTMDISEKMDCIQRNNENIEEESTLLPNNAFTSVVVGNATSTSNAKSNEIGISNDMSDGGKETNLFLNTLNPPLKVVDKFTVADEVSNNNMMSICNVDGLRRDKRKTDEAMEIECGSHSSKFHDDSFNSKSTMNSRNHLIINSVEMIKECEKTDCRNNNLCPETIAVESGHEDESNVNNVMDISNDVRFVNARNGKEKDDPSFNALHLIPSHPATSIITDESSVRKSLNYSIIDKIQSRNDVVDEKTASHSPQYSQFRKSKLDSENNTSNINQTAGLDRPHKKGNTKNCQEIINPSFNELNPMLSHPTKSGVTDASAIADESCVNTSVNTSIVDSLRGRKDTVDEITALHSEPYPQFRNSKLDSENNTSNINQASNSDRPQKKRNAKNGQRKIDPLYEAWHPILSHPTKSTITDESSLNNSVNTRIVYNLRSRKNTVDVITAPQSHHNSQFIKFKLDSENNTSNTSQEDDSDRPHKNMKEKGGQENIDPSCSAWHPILSHASKSTVIDESYVNKSNTSILERLRKRNHSNEKKGPHSDPNSQFIKSKLDSEINTSNTNKADDSEPPPKKRNAKNGQGKTDPLYDAWHPILSHTTKSTIEDESCVNNSVNTSIVDSIHGRTDAVDETTAPQSHHNSQFIKSKLDSENNTSNTNQAGDLARPHKKGNSKNGQEKIDTSSNAWYPILSHLTKYTLTDESCDNTSVNTSIVDSLCGTNDSDNERRETQSHHNSQFRKSKLDSQNNTAKTNHLKDSDQPQKKSNAKNEQEKIDLSCNVLHRLLPIPTKSTVTNESCDSKSVNTSIVNDSLHDRNNAVNEITALNSEHKPELKNSKLDCESNMLNNNQTGGLDEHHKKMNAKTGQKIIHPSFNVSHIMKSTVTDESCASKSVNTSIIDRLYGRNDSLDGKSLMPSEHNPQLRNSNIYSENSILNTNLTSDCNRPYKKRNAKYTKETNDVSMNQLNPMLSFPVKSAVTDESCVSMSVDTIVVNGGVIPGQNDSIDKASALYSDHNSRFRKFKLESENKILNINQKKSWDLLYKKRNARNWKDEKFLSLNVLYPMLSHLDSSTMTDDSCYNKLVDTLTVNSLNHEDHGRNDAIAQKTALHSEHTTGLIESKLDSENINLNTNQTRSYDWPYKKRYANKDNLDNNPSLNVLNLMLSHPDKSTVTSESCVSRSDSAIIVDSLPGRNDTVGENKELHSEHDSRYSKFKLECENNMLNSNQTKGCDRPYKKRYADINKEEYIPSLNALNPMFSHPAKSTVTDQFYVSIKPSYDAPFEVPIPISNASVTSNWDFRNLSTIHATAVSIPSKTVAYNPQIVTSSSESVGLKSTCDARPENTRDMSSVHEHFSEAIQASSNRKDLSKLVEMYPRVEVVEDPVQFSTICRELNIPDESSSMIFPVCTLNNHYPNPTDSDVTIINDLSVKNKKHEFRSISADFHESISNMNHNHQIPYQTDLHPSTTVKESENKPDQDTRASSNVIKRENSDVYLSNQVNFKYKSRLLSNFDMEKAIQKEQSDQNCESSWNDCCALDLSMKHQTVSKEIKTEKCVDSRYSSMCHFLNDSPHSTESLHRAFKSDSSCKQKNPNYMKKNYCYQSKQHDFSHYSRSELSNQSTNESSTYPAFSGLKEENTLKYDFHQPNQYLQQTFSHRVSTELHGQNTNVNDTHQTFSHFTDNREQSSFDTYRDTILQRNRDDDLNNRQLNEMARTSITRVHEVHSGFPSFLNRAVTFNSAPLNSCFDENNFLQTTHDVHVNVPNSQHEVPTEPDSQDYLNKHHSNISSSDDPPQDQEIIGLPQQNMCVNPGASLAAHGNKIGEKNSLNPMINPSQSSNHHGKSPRPTTTTENFKGSGNFTTYYYPVSLIYNLDRDFSNFWNRSDIFNLNENEFKQIKKSSTYNQIFSSRACKEIKSSHKSKTCINDYILRPKKIKRTTESKFHQVNKYFNLITPTHVYIVHFFTFHHYMLFTHLMKLNKITMLNKMLKLEWTEYLSQDYTMAILSILFFYLKNIH